MLGEIVGVREGIDELIGVNIATVRIGDEVREINIGRESFQPGAKIDITTIMRKFGLGHITESRVSAIKPRSKEVRQPRMAIVV